MFDESLCPHGKRWALKIVNRVMAREFVESAVWKIAAHALDTAIPGAFAAVSREVERQNEERATAGVCGRQTRPAPAMRASSPPVPTPRPPGGKQWWQEADS